ncbi:MAG: MSCRAMM family adhesin SdrC [Candidatus Peribacteria bacterium]|nr:MSCRAMM family adhesin SdrC [Candidatus Peribacteria bacterium]
MAQGVQLRISLDPNVIYSGASNPQITYDVSGHQLILPIGDLAQNNQHFTIQATIDPTKLTEDTIRYHSFNFVSSIQTTTLPEISNLDNVDSIDQRIVMVGDVYGKVYGDKDRILGRNPIKDKELSGYQVELRTLTGALVKTSLTKTTGQYQFLNVKPGTYQIVVPATGNYHNFGSFLGVLSGTAISTGEIINSGTIQLEIAADTIYADNDFSVISLTSSLSGKVILDTGIPLQGIELHLKNTTAQVVQKVFTDSEGYYHFSNIEAGTYHIQYLLPAMYETDTATVGSL